MNRQSYLLTVSFVLLFAFCPWAQAQRSLSDGIKGLATEISASAVKASVTSIAVVPLRELAGGPTVLGTYVAEALSTYFVNAGLSIVERNMLDKLLKEQSFQETGAVNPETAKRVGKLIGAEAIVTGSITNLKSVIAINCRVIDTRTGRIFAAAEAIVTRDAMVDEILGQALSSGSLSAPSQIKPKANTQLEVSFRTVTVKLDSLRVLSGGSIVVTLRFVNRGAKEILAALDGNLNNVYATDNVGNKYVYRDSSSIGRAHFINVERGSGGWLSCPPNADATASITFAPPRNMDEKGSIFSLSIPAHVGSFYVDNFGYSRVTEDGNFQIYFRDVTPQ